MAFNIHHPKFTMIAMVNLMIILFRNIFEKNFRKICLGLIAALWQCMGMRTRFSEHAENFGEEIFSRDLNASGKHLNVNYITIGPNREF